MIVGLLAALVSAFGYGIASVLQASAAGEEPDSGGVDATLLARLIRRRRFVAGVALDLVGFAAQFLALRTLAVFVVQAVQASSLAITAVASIPLLGAHLRGREWGAIGAVCVGLGLLALSAGDEGPDQVPASFRWALLAATVLTIVVGYAVAHLKHRFAPVALGFMAGLGFGVVALAARVLTQFEIGRLLRDPALYAMVLGGVVSFLFYATALQRGKVTTVTAAVIVGETLLPALVGVIVLGDRTRPGFVPVAVAGFGIAIAGALTLARFGEPALPHSVPTP
jgi:drug/metabolite transporter (DMT)-like permease